MARSGVVREDVHGQRRSSGALPPRGGNAIIGRRLPRTDMSTRSPQPAASTVSLVDEVAALAAEVREQVTRLRPLVDGRDVDPASELTVLLGALNTVAGKLEARCHALRAGEPATPVADTPTPITRSRRGADPEEIAREMVSSGASRTEVEDFLRRHFERADARRIARRALRPTAEPRPSRRRDR